MDFTSITNSIKDKITSISAYNMGGQEVHANGFEGVEEKESVSPIFLTPLMSNDLDTPTFLIDPSNDAFVLDSTTDSTYDSGCEGTDYVVGTEAGESGTYLHNVPAYPLLSPFISDLRPVLPSAISSISKKPLKGRSVSFLNSEVSVFTKMFGCGCAGVLSDDGDSSPTSPEDILDRRRASDRVAPKGCFNIPAEEYLLQSEIWVEERTTATKVQIMEMHAKVTEVMSLVQAKCLDLTENQRAMLHQRLVSLHSDVSSRLSSYSSAAFEMLPYPSMEEAFEASVHFCKGAGEALNEAVSDFVKSVHRQILMMDIPSKLEQHHCVISGKVASMAMLVRDMMQEHIVEEAKRMIAASAQSLGEHKVYLTKRAVSAASSACDLISDSLSPNKVRKILDDCIDMVMESVCDRLDEIWGRGKVAFDKMMKDLKTSLEEFVINSPESLHRSPRDFSLVRYED